MKTVLTLIKIVIPKKYYKIPHFGNHLHVVCKLKIGTANLSHQHNKQRGASDDPNAKHRPVQRHGGTDHTHADPRILYHTGLYNVLPFTYICMQNHRHVWRHRNFVACGTKHKKSGTPYMQFLYLVLVKFLVHNIQNFAGIPPDKSSDKHTWDLMTSFWFWR